jgi:hypothetical protein
LVAGRLSGVKSTTHERQVVAKVVNTLPRLSVSISIETNVTFVCAPHLITYSGRRYERSFHGGLLRHLKLIRRDSDMDISHLHWQDNHWQDILAAKDGFELQELGTS